MFKEFIRFFTSLRLTVVLLALSLVLVFFATIDQVHLGIWAVQQKWFHSLVVLQNIKGFPVPVYPGGYFIGGLLMLNLITAYLARFKFSWKKSGIIIIHAGLVLLLVGELISGIVQRDFQMRLDEGQTGNYSESPRRVELAVVDVTDPDYDEVVAIPSTHLSSGEVIQNAKLPFKIKTHYYYPNSSLMMKAQAPNVPESGATQGMGPRFAVMPQSVSYSENDRNLPSALVELEGPDGSLGKWLLSTWLIQPETFDYAGRTFRMSLRFERAYTPYKMTLLDFSHDTYVGTDIPKNFSSKIRIQNPDTGEDREVLIYMNNPLRYEGLTYYQAGFENNNKTTVLQVVHNPSWLIPYIACLVLTIGMLIQFGIHLVGFARKRKAAI